MAVGRLGKQVAQGARFNVGGREARTRVIVTVTAMVALLAGFGIYQLTSGGGTPANAPVIVVACRATGLLSLGGVGPR